MTPSPIKKDAPKNEAYSTAFSAYGCWADMKFSSLRPERRKHRTFSGSMPRRMLDTSAKVPPSPWKSAVSTQQMYLSVTTRISDQMISDVAPDVQFQVNNLRSSKRDCRTFDVFVLNRARVDVVEDR